MFEPEPGRFFNHAESRTASRALADLCPRNAGMNRLAQRSSHAAIGAITAIVVEIRREVPQVPLPGRHDARRRAIEVVDLLGEITLDVPDDLASPAYVEGATLEADHLR